MPTALRPARLTVILIVVAMVAMWGYVTFLAFGPGRADPVDRLDDPTFAAAAEQRCAEARGRIDALPTAAESPDHLARAAVIDEANEVLSQMLDDLAGITPPGEDGVLVELWLADWRTYLGDRQRYADRLRVDPDARLLVSAKAGRHITGPIDGFAEDNRMPSCEVPPDV